MGTVHPKLGIGDQLQNWEGHVGLEGWVASVGEDAVGSGGTKGAFWCPPIGNGGGGGGWCAIGSGSYSPATVKWFGTGPWGCTIGGGTKMLGGVAAN